MIPTHCVGCGTLALTCATLLSPQGSTVCQCGAVGRALPGAIYGPEDQLLFDAVVFAIKSAGVTWQTALRLLMVLEDCRTAEPLVKLRAFKQFAPALSVVELVAVDDPAAARKAVGLFELLLEAIAQTESQSGLLEIGASEVDARRATNSRMA